MVSARSTVSMREGNPLQSRETWLKAGLRAVATGGLAAIKIGPMAKELGITRGSFYWHFQDRDDLISAVLDHWEDMATTEVLKKLRARDNPKDRIVILVRRAYADREQGWISAALSAATDSPAILKVVRRVTKTRLAFLQECYEEMGYKEFDAKKRAWRAYSCYVGLFEILKTAKLSGIEMEEYLVYLAASLVAGNAT